MCDARRPWNEGHENGVAERAGLDGEGEAFQIDETGVLAVFCLGTSTTASAIEVIRRRRR